MLKLSYLQCFKVAAETENFTKAAELLHISQPALSHAIKELQNDIGCSLFYYKGRGVVLNTYGKILLEHVNDAMDSLNEGERKIHMLTSPDSGTVKVSCLYSLGVNLLPYIIRDFRKEHPNIHIDLIQQCTQVQLNLLNENKVDLCFCTDFDIKTVDKNDELDKVTVLIEDLYVLVNKNHRFAGRKEINLKELDNEDYISFSDLTFFQKSLKPVFDKLNIHPRIVYENNEDSTVAGFVAAGLGVAVIPPIIGVDFSKCVALKISYPVCQRTMSMVWKRTSIDQPPVKVFHDFIIKWLPDDKKYISPFYP